MPCHDFIVSFNFVGQGSDSWKIYGKGMRTVNRRLVWKWPKIKSAWNGKCFVSFSYLVRDFVAKFWPESVLRILSGVSLLKKETALLKSTNLFSFFVNWMTTGQKWFQSTKMRPKSTILLRMVPLTLRLECKPCKNGFLRKSNQIDPSVIFNDQGCIRNDLLSF